MPRRQTRISARAAAVPAGTFAGRALLLLSLAGAVALLIANPVHAQALRSPSVASLAAGPSADRNSLATPSTTGLPGVSARQSVSTGTGSGSAISILGMPLRAAAPVEAPYNSDAAYTTFAGQPLRGRDAGLQQSIDGAP